MVVDDDEGVREAIADVLTLDGYAVLTADDGTTALEVLHKAPRPCVALIDLVMPRLNGWQLVQTLVRDAAWRGIGVICTTAGRAEPPEGCAVVLRKPFDDMALADAVERAFATVR